MMIMVKRVSAHAKFRPLENAGEFSDGWRWSPRAIGSDTSIRTASSRSIPNSTVRLAKDPFFPRMFIASGAAYSSGYPLTIDGNPSSIAQAHAVQTFFNRIKTYEVAEARENERTTLIDIDIKRDDIIYRTASLYLDAERATQISEFVARQIQEFEKIHEVVSARVAEGKELEIEKDKAVLNVARATQRAAALSLD